MSTRFVEGNLCFDFNDQWTPIKYWDREAAYKYGLRESTQGRAVDIIGVWNRRAVYFIEIKDYRQHPRQKNEDPWVEFELKVRDTVAALVGASRREEYAADCGPLLDALIKHRDLVLVFWLEEPANSNILNVAMEKRRLAGASFRTRQVKSHLKWLRAKVVSARRSDDYSRFIPGLEVTSLSRKRQQIIQAILKHLEARGLEVPEELRQRIADIPSLETLEGWLSRAPEVSSAWELIQNVRKTKL